MDIPNIPNVPPLSNSSLQDTTKAIQDSLKSWQTGQIVKAMVIKPTLNSLATLQIGKQTLPVTTQIPLAVGQTVQVKLSIEAGQPTLRLQPPPLQSNPIPSLMRGLLPTQESLAPLLANLFHYAKQLGPKSKLPNLPDAVAKLTQQLIKSIPTVKEIHKPMMLKQHLENSGLLLERKLLSESPKAQLRADLKAQLLQLAAAIEKQVKPSVVPTKTVNAPPTPHPTDKQNAPTKTAPTPEKPLSAPLAKALHAPPPPPAPSTAKPRKAFIPPSSQATEGKPATSSGLQNNNTQNFLAPKTHYSQPSPPNINQPLQTQARAMPTLAHHDSADDMMTEILRQIHSSIARVQLHQISSLPGDNAPQQLQTWLLEVPIKHEEGLDLFQMQVEEEAPDSDQEDSEHHWSITLAFDLDNLGPIRVRVTVINKAVSTIWWVADKSIETRLQTDLAELHDSLEEKGLTVKEIEIGHQTTTTRNPQSHGGYLDTQA